MSPKRIIVLAIHSTVLILFPSVVYAQISFTPISPTSCPRQQAWVWDSNGSQDQGPIELFPYDMTQYHNNQTTVRHFVANKLTGSIEFFVTDRAMAAGDILRFRQAGRGPADERTATGVDPNDVWISVPSTSLVRPIVMTFTSNASVTNTGFRIGNVRYCPTTDPAFGTTITSGERYVGVLQGFNDVIYFGISGPSVGHRLHITTWGGSVNRNVDVYVRCGALPTPTVFLRAATTSVSEEFVHVTNAECSSSQTLFIAVHSGPGVSGVGTFNLVAQRFGLVWPQYNIAMEAPSPTEIATFTETVRRAARFMYGATEGHILMQSIKLVSRPSNSINDDSGSCLSACTPVIGQSCDGCLLQGNGTPHAWFDVSWVTFRNWIDNHQVIVHEAGHADFGVDDEYVIAQPQDARCGHSLMAYQGQMPNFCTSLNHNLDPRNGAPPVSFGAAWDLADQLDFPPANTPDQHLYEGHPLNGNPVITLH